jgi:Fic family protein
MTMPEPRNPRAGRLVRQPGGYRAFIPAPLPPDPPLRFDAQLVSLLATASTDLGRLDGVSATMPNPDLFVAMYVRREAVLSSQIEGTQSTLDDVLTFEVDPGADALPLDIDVVVNYVKAMKYGLARLDSLPLSLRLIKEIHDQLLTGVRGGDKSPGEFRATQNWIGGGDRQLLSDATFVPPPPDAAPAHHLRTRSCPIRNDPPVC